MRRVCRYCGLLGWTTVREEPWLVTGAVRHELCACGRRHPCCELCWRTKSRVVGDFPYQGQKMPACPSPAQAKTKGGSL